MPEHHIVLGGYGFIGRHVALRLVRAGKRVTLVGRHPSSIVASDEFGDLFGAVHTEIASADWDTLVADADVVHHYAWSSVPASANSNPGGDLRANVAPTIELLDALRRRGGGRVIFSSSGGTVYGHLRQIPVPESHPIAPINAYGAGKAAVELFLGLYRAMSGIDCRVARISNAYGAGQDLSRGVGAVTTFLGRALNGQPITIWGSGETIRDYIHVSDISRFLITLADAEMTEEFTFNVGSGVGTSLNEVVSGLEFSLGHPLLVERTENRSFDIPVSVLSIERAATVLGWKPRLSFSEGLALTIADVRQNRHYSTLIGD